MSCYVKHCKNLKRLVDPESKITFHRFPTNTMMFRKWLSVVCAPDVDINTIKWTKTRFICSEHFKPEDYVIGCKIRILNALAVPSVNLSKYREITTNVSLEHIDIKPSISESFISPPLSQNYEFSKSPSRKRSGSESDCDSKDNIKRIYIKEEHDYE